MHDLGKGVSQPTSDRLSLAHRMDVVPRTRVAPAPFPAVHPFVINVVLSLSFSIALLQSFASFWVRSPYLHIIVEVCLPLFLLFFFPSSSLLFLCSGY